MGAFGLVPMHYTARGVIIKVDNWFPTYGSVADLDIAWFQIRGIPADNRNCSSVSFAGSMVGRTFAVDKFSLKMWSM